jgi:hypothetical protein
MAHFQGDVENAEHYLRRAQERGGAPEAVAENALMVYSNLVYATKAQAAARTSVDIRFGNVREKIASVLASGGVSQVRTLLGQAEKAGLDMDTIAQMAAMKEIAANMPQTAEEDKRMAAAIDCAGEVLRERKLFWLERAPRFRYDASTGCMGIRYRVAVAPSEAAQMTLQVADLLIARQLQDVPLTLGFTGVRV